MPLVLLMIIRSIPQSCGGVKVVVSALRFVLGVIGDAIVATSLNWLEDRSQVAKFAPMGLDRAQLRKRTLSHRDCGGREVPFIS
jgi:hypothetical protein